jgi:hypothetical protein
MVLVTWGWAAAAQESDLTKQDKEQAAASFKNGQALYKQGFYLEAAASFERAHRLRPHPHAMANIGHCYDGAGDYPRAVEAFRKFLEHPDQKNSPLQERVTRRLEELASKVGDLYVHCHPRPCSVTVDEVYRGVMPTNIVLLVGAHQVKVMAVDGGETRQYDVAIRPGERTVLDVQLTAKPLGEVPSSEVDGNPQPDDGPVRFRAPFWVATAATIAGLGAVVVVGVMNYSTMEEFKKGGSTDEDLKRRGDELVLGQNIAIGLTAGAAATAVVLAIVDIKSRRGPKGDRGRATLFPVFGSTSGRGAYVGLAVRTP